MPHRLSSHLQRADNGGEIDVTALPRPPIREAGGLFRQRFGRGRGQRHDQGLDRRHRFGWQVGRFLDHQMPVRPACPE